MHTREQLQHTKKIIFQIIRTYEKLIKTDELWPNGFLGRAMASLYW